MVPCASIKDLSIEKRILKIAQKYGVGWQKCFRDFFGLNFAKNLFLQFQGYFGHNGVKIGENVFFYLRIKKAFVNFDLKSLFTS